VLHNIYICDDEFYDGSSEVHYRKMHKNEKDQVHYCYKGADKRFSAHSKYLKTASIE
jgi:hypothetical protein